MKMGKLVLLLLVMLLTAVQGFGQFSGPAFDKDVFVPEKGTDIDFLYSSTWATRGWYLYNLGPAPNGSEDRVSFKGFPSNPDFQTIFDATPPFLLNNLKVIQTTNVQFPSGNRTIFGNFRSTRVRDALVDEGTSRSKFVIYWADENGLFDTSRRTYLKSSIRSSSSTTFYFDMTTAYVTDLTSDDIDDIVVGGSAEDSAYILLYIGGSSLFHLDSVYQDTSKYFGKKFTPTWNRRYGTVADFRGTGRRDFLASDFYGSWFFYKNDPPFTLEKFVESMILDTLLSKWDNPNLDEYNYPYVANRFTMQALPRPSWDKSVDFMPALRTNDWRSKAIAIFRGGPNFGQHRLTLDSAELYLRSPGLIDGAWSGLAGVGPLLDAGDMTGTGNPVLMAAGSYGHIGNYLFFYTLGRAIDEKVDAVVPFTYASLTGEQISLNADNDKYRDVLFGAFNRNSDSEPIPGRAELWLLHGTSRIPAKLNPNYAVPASYSIQHGLTIYPNPAREKIALTYDLHSSGNAVLTLQDVLGRVVWTHSFYAEADGESIELVLPELTGGLYVVMLHCEGQTLTTHMMKL